MDDVRRRANRGNELAIDRIHQRLSECGLVSQRGNNVSGPRSPIEPSECRLFDLEGVHQRNDVESDHRLLPVSNGFARQKARRSITAQIGDDHPVAGRRQQRRDIDKAVNVVRPAVQENDRRSIVGTRFDISNVEQSRIDLLQGAEGRARCPALLSLGRFWFDRLCHVCPSHVISVNDDEIAALIVGPESGER